MCRLSVFILDNERKEKIIREMNKKCCLILLGEPYTENTTTKDMIVIDIISKRKNLKNCVFLETINIDEILKGTKNTVMKEKPSILLFDNVHSLLNYHQNNEIIRFTNELKCADELRNLEKIYFIPRETDHLENETYSLTNDLKLFADEFKVLS